MLYALIQRNGERIPIEEWALRMLERGESTDPMLLRFYNGAVAIRPFGWPVSAAPAQGGERA